VHAGGQILDHDAFPCLVAGDVCPDRHPSCGPGPRDLQNWESGTESADSTEKVRVIRNLLIVFRASGLIQGI